MTCHGHLPPPPTLSVSTDSIALGRDDSTAVFTVQNAGIGSVSWQITRLPIEPWFLSVQPTAGVLTAGESADVHIQISRTGLDIGNYSGSLEITAPGAEASPQTIQFDFDVPNTIPDLAASPNQLEFSGVENGTNPAGQQILILNIGGGTLAWTATVTDSPGWLFISGTSGHDDSRIMAHVDIAGMAPGVYSTSILVQDPAAVNSPLTIPISLVVREEPVGPVLAEFEAETSASLPNSGWGLVMRAESQGLEARISNVKIPPASNRLDFTFNVPEDVTAVWVFAELDVHANSSDDSFWLTVNGQNLCNWNNLAGLGNGWRRSWVYNLGKNRQQLFEVEPGENTISLYPREDGTIINWLVVTTDNMTDIENYVFNEIPPPPPAPQLSLLPEQIQFSAIVGGDVPEFQQIQVLNVGGSELSWTAAKTPGSAWLSLLHTSGVSGDQLELLVSTAGLPIGTYTAEVIVSDAAAENSPLILPVTLTVSSDEPMIVVSPAVLSFEAIENGAAPSEQLIQISNGGFGTLNWSLAENPDQSWLTLSSTADTNAAAVRVIVNPAGLTPGPYACTITVTDPQAENSPYSVPVHFDIQPEPSGPVLAQFEAEGSASLPNPGWENVVQLEKLCLKAAVSDISSPPEDHKLEYLFTVPPGISTVYVFGEVEVHRERNDDSFWVNVNENNTAKWNGLVSLGGGWRRSWVYDQGKNKKQPFPVQPGANTLCLYPRESNGFINWLVITTDPEQDIQDFDFSGGAPPEPVEPHLAVQPPQLAFVQYTGEPRPAVKQLTISNSGDGNLNWTAAVQPVTAWLSVSPMSGSAGQKLTVQADGTNLGIGIYAAGVRIISAEADNSPLDVPVSLAVTVPQPQISSSVESIAFSAVVDGTAPAAVSVIVRNTGRSQLHWYAVEKIERDWLNIQNGLGGDAASFQVTVSPAGLPVGMYSSVIQITDAAASNSPVEIPVEFRVAPEATETILAAFQVERNAALPNSGWRRTIIDNDSGLVALKNSTVQPDENYRLDYKFYVPPGVLSVYLFAEVEVHNNFRKDSFWIQVNDEELCNWENLKPICRSGWARSWVYDYPAREKYEFTVVPDTNVISIFSRERDAAMNWLVVTTDPELDINEFEFPENLARQLAKSREKPLPEAFRLAQNTPNPFNPSTRIEFDLPEAGLVKLDVFNLLGREVVSLVNGNLNAGRYDIHWNAHNQKGRMVASGMYFYRLTVKPTNSPRDRFMQVRKMMLTR